MGLHVMQLRTTPALTREEAREFNRLPRPRPTNTGAVIRRRPGKDPVRVPRGQAALLKD
jgi:hypothetical protein